MHHFLELLLPTLALAAAIPLHPHLHLQHSTKSPIKCPIIFDGRIPANASLATFDTASSPYNPDFVKGENRTWSSILLLPHVPRHSRFDIPGIYKPLEVTIDDGSLFRAGEVSIFPQSIAEHVLT
jgi:hypothetical protein